MLHSPEPVDCNPCWHSFLEIALARWACESCSRQTSLQRLPYRRLWTWPRLCLHKHSKPSQFLFIHFLNGSQECILRFCLRNCLEVGEDIIGVLHTFRTKCLFGRPLTLESVPLSSTVFALVFPPPKARIQKSDKNFDFKHMASWQVPAGLMNAFKRMIIKCKSPFFGIRFSTISFGFFWCIFPIPSMYGILTYTFGCLLW